MFKRRNAIAHQNDRSHDSGIQDDIDKSYVVDNIETVKRIAHEIFSIAMQSNKGNMFSNLGAL